MTTEHRAVITCPHCKKEITVRDVSKQMMSILETMDKSFQGMWKRVDKLFDQINRPR
jgi:hypothetical protein